MIHDTKNIMYFGVSLKLVCPVSSPPLHFLLCSWKTIHLKHDRIIFSGILLTGNIATAKKELIPCLKN
jgi:hypothetical protein